MVANSTKVCRCEGANVVPIVLSRQSPGADGSYGQGFHSDDRIGAAVVAGGQTVEG